MDARDRKYLCPVIIFVEKNVVKFALRSIMTIRECYRKLGKRHNALYLPQKNTVSSTPKFTKM